MAGIWGQTRRQHDAQTRSIDAAQLPPTPRWNPHPPGFPPMRHRIEFDPGAPAFAYDLYGPVEYPIVAGFSPKYQFYVTQPPSDIYPLHLLEKGLGQSANMQPPFPATATLYTPDQLAILMAGAQQAAWGANYG